MTRLPSLRARGVRPARRWVIFWAALLLSSVVGLAGSSVPSNAAAGTFSLDRLRLGGLSGPENYEFTAGDAVFPDGGVQSGTFYKVVVTDAAGTVRNPTFPCTPASAFTTTDNTYTVRAADPVSTGTSWRFTSAVQHFDLQREPREEREQELLRRQGERVRGSCSNHPEVALRCKRHCLCDRSGREAGSQ
jgi:hypothetical protein